MPATPADPSNTLVYRLAQFLIKLNQGEKLDPQALAEEFGVTRRTIQRNLNERLVYLPLEKTEGRDHLNAAFLGKISTDGLTVSSKVAHINQIFPTVRQWIPHIRIISPPGLQAQMKRELRDYLASASA